MEAEFDGVRIIPEPITTEELVVSIPNQSHRIHLNDAPYDMFAIPYGEITMKNANVKCNKDGSMAIAFYAAAEMGSGVVYDVQLLPYCPCLDWIDDRGRIDESYGQEGYEYSYIKDSQGNKKSIMIWCNHSSGTFNIEQKIEIERPYTETTSSGSILAPFSKSLLTIQSQVGTIPKRGILVVQNAFLKNYKLKTLTTMNISAQSIGVTDTVRANQIVSMQQDMNIGRLTILYNANSGFIYNRTADDATGTIQGLWSRTTKTYNNDEAIDIKISDNCDKYRLVSPNYNGQFEFSLAKNGGSIEYFNVDYTYKPYNPYIHVNPNFSGLYGRDFDDARGLICGGNFSLPIVTSAFTDFEVANKNYNAIFDREILNMDREHEIQRQEATFGAIAGAVKGGATGAAAGAMVGGP